MNYWTDLSIQYASQRNYLDELFRVYPTVPEGIRDIDNAKWQHVTEAYNNHDDVQLLKNLLTLELFPIKDSYVAYLKRDVTALERNPETARRLAGRLYEMGLEEIFKRSSEPKETNRQIGPLFRLWLRKQTLGLPLQRPLEFQGTSDDAILDGSDAELMAFARSHLAYDGTKGLDFLARIHGKYVAGEAKFLTDFGGHQNAQFEDAKTLLRNRSIQAITIAVLDGVLYIAGNNKMYQYLKNHEEEYNIMSSLVLREFLYQIT